MAETPLRFVVSVDQAWQVLVSCPEQNQARPSRAMRRLDDGRRGFFPLPPVAELSEQAPGAELPACCRLYCRAEDPAVLTEGRRRITERSPDPQIGTSPFGGYLFHALIGAAAWQWIREIADRQHARCIELALCWDDGDANLNRLNWEMMHDGQDFLATGLPGITIAITRLVARTTGVKWEPRKVEEFPPRILFVIGTTLNDPSLRPAAEFLGLLRELRESGRRIRPRVLEKARPRELARVISVFRPDVVHFICHGDWDPETRRGFLELTPDEQNGEPRRFADQLYNVLTVNAQQPPLVVLSACRTGSAEAGAPVPSDVLKGAHDLAPLATELVRLGIPLVLGMAGRVSDNACRLFTRQFGDALVRGESLVVATAEARRATVSQGRSANESVDWAFPALFAAEQVEPGWAPVRPGAGDGRTPEEIWIDGYKLNRDLVFCGRNDFFSAYYGFFAPNPRRVLAIVTEGQSGIGRKRLLFELAAQMLRDGHIPIILASENPTWKAPPSLQRFCEMLVETIRQVRGILELGSAPDSQLRLLTQDRSAAGAGVSLLHDDIQDELGPDGELTPGALSRAMQSDLHRLVKDARRQHESVRRAEGRAVIVLDQVEQYGQSLLNAVIYEMLGEYGFGSRDEPVPAVLAVAMGQPATTIVKDILEQVASWSWICQLPLKPFDFETEEDLLAYSWILLNPPPNFPIGRHYLDYGAGHAVVKMARNFMQEAFAGLPGRFANRDQFVGFTSKIQGAFACPMPSDADDRTTLMLALGRADRDGSP
jgi:hypothetical protein